VRARRDFLSDFAASAAAFLMTAACNREKLFEPRPRKLGRSFFGHMVQGSIINHDGSTSQPITIPIGILRGWNCGASFEWVYRNEWEGFDRLLRLGESLGAEILYVLAGEPDTALPSLDEWRAFVRAAVDRSAGRIGHWELWNEPVFCRGASAADMAVYSREAYSIIKATYPWATVLSPSLNELLTSYGRKYADEYLRTSHFADAIAFHSYDPANRLSEVLGLVRGLSDLPLWNTETASADLFGTFVTHALAGVDVCVWNAQIDGCADYDADYGLGATYRLAFDTLMSGSIPVGRAA
jgi:hypothetical protein